MNMILSADRNWGIGLKNNLLVRIPEDMKFFRGETTGKVIVMGRKTLETFPNGQPLPNRTNLVLSANTGYHVKGAQVFHTMEDILKELEKYPTEDVYIVGGGSVYRQFLPYCDVIHVTKIAYAYDADTYFPNLDEMPEWRITGVSGEKTYYDLEFEFVKYERRA